MKKYEKQNESGRSMVEMLGVLAIMGVLSIGGVAGYGRAMKTYRTNSAMETAEKQAAIVASEIGFGQAVSPGSATKLKAPAGYEVAIKNVQGTDGDITSTTPYFGVEVGGNSTGSNSTPLQSEVAKEMLERAIGEWKNVHAFGVKSSDGSSITWLNSTGSGDHGFEAIVGDAQTVVIIVVYASDLSLRPETGLNVRLFTGGSNGENSGSNQPQTDPCDNITCQNGGTCSNGVCECPSGYGGDTCEIQGEPCTANGYCPNWGLGAGGEFCQMTSETSGICQIRGTVTMHYMCNGVVNIYNYSSEQMNFWTARNWCQDHSGWGGHLMTETSGRSCPGDSSTCPNQCWDKPYWDASGRICAIKNGSLVCTAADPRTKAYAYCHTGK